MAQLSTQEVSMIWRFEIAHHVISAISNSMTLSEERSTSLRHRLARSRSTYQDRMERDRPNGAALVPLSRRKPLACDVIVPNPFAASHIQFTLISADAAADITADSKAAKYDDLAAAHQFVPIDVKTCFVTARAYKDV